MSIKKVWLATTFWNFDTMFLIHCSYFCEKNLTNSLSQFLTISVWIWNFEKTTKTCLFFVVKNYIDI
jgi:hypothetical protein